MNDIHIPSPCRLANTQCNFQWVSKSRVTPDVYHSTLSLSDNHDRVFSFRVTPDSYHSTLSLRDNNDSVFSFRVTPDSYHSTLSLRDNMTVCFLSLGQQNFSAYTASLLHPYRNFGYLHGSLTPHRNLGYLHGSLTPTQKFWTTPRVSYTHTEISDNSTGLLHPHRSFG